MFTVRHELPPNAYFGHLPNTPAERSERFDDHGMKNWALAGLLPYSGWSSKELLEKHDQGSINRIEDLAIETRFGTIDTIVWVVPGFFYGYYLWAPRTVEVTGSRVIRNGNGR
jgi:hypothetical protein